MSKIGARDPFTNVAGLSKPDSAAGKLQRILLAMLREHERNDALPTYPRFLFYELVVRRIVSKEKTNAGRRNDQNMQDALTHLRDKGVIPWDWLDDETRKFEDFTGWGSINEWAMTSVPYVRLDPWRGRAPFILTESRSVTGVLRKTVDECRARTAPVGGHCAGFLRTIAAELKPGDTVGYVGDGDLCGGQIEANTRKVLERLIGGELDWTRVALTDEQVARYHLEEFRILKTDKRYKPPLVAPAIECEALQQHILVDIVREWLESLLPEPLRRVREREERQRANLRAALAKLARAKRATR
jgi:hypothetical protein